MVIVLHMFTKVFGLDATFPLSIKICKQMSRGVHSGRIAGKPLPGVSVECYGSGVCSLTS